MGWTVRLWTTAPQTHIDTIVRSRCRRSRRYDRWPVPPGHYWLRPETRWPWLMTLTYRRRDWPAHGYVYLEQLQPGSVAWSAQRERLREPCRRQELGAWAERAWMRMRRAVK